MCGFIAKVKLKSEMELLMRWPVLRVLSCLPLAIGQTHTA